VAELADALDSKSVAMPGSDRLIDASLTLFQSPGPLLRIALEIIFDCRTVNDPAACHSMVPAKTMSVGERDKLMNDIATKAATEFCRKCEATGTNDQMIRAHPEAYLNYTIPYLTVRTLHRLEADSGWIKAFAIITGVLTFALLALTAVLAIYALRLDRVIQSLSQ
jgi:hypothetical protein